MTPRRKFKGRQPSATYLCSFRLWIFNTAQASKGGASSLPFLIFLLTFGPGHVALISCEESQEYCPRGPKMSRPSSATQLELDQKCYSPTQIG